MLIDHLNRQLREREAQALTRRRRIAESPCAPHQRVSRNGEPARDLLAFCSNDYLGLANHPVLIEALAEGARRFGAGSGASHLINGHSRAHATLEDELAAWLAPHIPNAEALTFCTGYMANLALLTALGDASASIFSDKLNHASLIDGALLAKAPLQRYPHGNLALLERQLERCTTPIKLIVTDAVFSMDGDLADLPALLALAERFDAWLIVDDAHGFGVLGAQGRGSLAHFNLRSERLIYMGTLGKAAGLGGAFVAAHPSIIEWLVQSARPYIYTTATPPALAHALSASLRLIGGEEGKQRRAHLQQLIALLRTQLAALIEAYPHLSWRLCDSATAIQPLIVGDNAAALALAAALDAQGLWVPAIRPPTVPAGTARLRITLSAAHSAADVQLLLDGLARAARDLSKAVMISHTPSTAPSPVATSTRLHGCFVTGTDTEVGKTHISAALLHWCAQQGWASAGFKPVAAGTSLIGGECVNEDVRALREAGSLSLSDAEVGPFQFETACAPHIAATLAGQAIDRVALLRAAQALATRADVLVIEGVGGFCVPLGPDWDSADLACDFQLPVVLVVGLRLGCINHALLTAQAVRARGLRLLGWIGNVVDADMPWVDENITCLRERLWRQHQAPCLGLVPWLDQPTPANVAAHLDATALNTVFASSFSSLASS